MKYLNLYSDQASAVGQIVNTPNVCVIDGMDKTLFIPASAGNSVKIIEDDDFINYTDLIEFVDLGLPSGTLWMKCNIGAEKETDYGSYFQWGAITEFSTNPSGYAFWSTCPGYGDLITWDATNLTNNVLNTSVDAAYVHTNGKAKMPTQTQCQELIDGTNSEWTTIDSVAGRKFTNKSDSSKYIFVPATNCYYEGQRLYKDGVAGLYLTSSLDSSNTYHTYMYKWYVSDQGAGGGSTSRVNPATVRGVKNV